MFKGDWMENIQDKYSIKFVNSCACKMWLELLAVGNNQGPNGGICDQSLIISASEKLLKK